MGTVVELSEPGPGDGLRVAVKDGRLSRLSYERDTRWEQRYKPSGRKTQDGTEIWVRDGERQVVQDGRR